MMKCPQTSQALAVTIALTLLATLSPPLESLVQARAALRFHPPTPPRSGTPTGRVQGGGTRDTCPAVSVPLTALVHFQTKDLTQYVLGETTLSHPTFWFYMPYTNWSAYPAEFLLREGGQEEDEGAFIYKAAIALPDKPGIMGIPLPASAPPLIPGKSYRWFFKIYCNQPHKTDPMIGKGIPVSVEGAIQRVSLSKPLADQLATASPRQQVELYAANGIWYEALTTLANLRLASPQDPDLAADWRSLLKSVELENTATAPLIKQ